MKTTIAEHTLNLNLLPEKANILDLGCRGFLFANELTRQGHNVVCVDVDYLQHPDYHRLAITGENGFVEIIHSKDAQATSVKPTHKFTHTESMTLAKFSGMVGVPFWDLIKIDIEGAEYEVIMSLTEPPAKQLSIEFHIHTGIYGQQAIAQMEGKLAELGYVTVSHEFTSQHGAGFNYWDSLFILK